MYVYICIYDIFPNVAVIKIMTSCAHTKTAELGCRKGFGERAGL